MCHRKTATLLSVLVALAAVSPGCVPTLQLHAIVQTSPLADGTTNQAYSLQFAVTNPPANLGDLTWTAQPTTSSSVPPGLTLSTDGLLMGTPTAAGAYMFIITVDDSNRHKTLDRKTFQLTVNAAAIDLKLIKTHTGNFTVGSNGTYTLTVTNVGNTPTTGAVTVTDTLPAGLSFVSGSGTGWTCSAAAQVVTCTNPGPIAATTGSNMSVITLTVSVAAAARPNVTNSATVAASGDNNAANNTASDPTTVNAAPVIDLSLAKTHIGSFNAGSNGLYTLTVTNVGGAASGMITVTDTLPNGMSFVSGTGTGWTCAAASQVVTCTNPGLAAGNGTNAIALTVNIASTTIAGMLTNAASVTTSGDTNAANDAASDITNVVAAARATSTAVAFAPGSVPVNQGSTVTVTVTDTGAGAPSNPLGTVSFGSSAGGDAFTPAPTCSLVAVAMSSTQSSCSATVLPVAPAGPHTISATYTPTDNIHATSNSTGALAVNARATSTVAVLSPGTVAINQSSTVTITVTDTDAGTPLNPLGTASLNSSVAGDVFAPSMSCTLAPVPATTDKSSCTATVTPIDTPGSHAITAAFVPAGSPHSPSSNSTSPASLTVTLRATATSVALVPNPVVTAQSLTATVTVADASAGTQSPPGVATAVAVSSSDGSDLLTSPCTLAAATASTSSCTVMLTASAMVSPPAHTITANFAATPTHAASTGNQDLTVVAPSVAITTTAVSAGAVTLFYSQLIEAVGGTGPYTWAVISGTPPPGLTLDPVTGILSGTPTATGMFTFTVQVMDSSGPPTMAIRTFTINVTLPVARFVFMSNQDGTISTYTVDATTGQLRANGYAPPAGLSTFTVALGRFLYTPGLSSLFISKFDPVTGVINPPATATRPPGGNGVILAIPGVDRLLFTGGAVVDIDQTTGAVTPIVGSPFSGLGGRPAIDPLGKFYFSAVDSVNVVTNTNQISAFVIDPATSALTAAPGSPFIASTCPMPIAPGHCAPGPIVVDPSSNFLYLLNTATSTSGISAFRISQADAVLTAVSGSPFAVGATFASMAVAMTPGGGFMYLTQTGSPNISGFQIDAATGALTSAGLFTSFSGSVLVAVAADPTGKFLYATGNDNLVTVYGINPDGTLTETGSIRNQHMPLATVISAGPQAEYVPKIAYSANFGSATAPVSSGNVSAYTVDAVSGALNAVAGSPFLAGMNPSAVAVDPTHRFAYVTNFGDNTVSVFTIASSGALAPVGSFATGLGPRALAVDPTGRFLYVTNQNDSVLSAFTIDQTSGSLSSFQPPGTPNGINSPASIAIDPSGIFFYVAEMGGSEVSIYKIFDFTVGRFLQVGHLSTGAGTVPTSVVVDPSGNFLYVADQSGRVVVFAISSTGTLTPLVPAQTSPGTMPASLVVDPSGRFLYTANSGSSDVSGFTIGFPAGLLNPFTGAPAAAGSAPSSVAVNPSGKFLYVANRTSGTISMFAIDPASGVLTPVNSFPAGVNPQSVVVGGTIQ